MAKRSSSRGGTNGKNAWGKARETTQGDSSFGDAIPVEPGTYTMQIVAAEVGDFGGDIKLMRKWCVIDHDEFEGAICTEWEGPLTDPDRLVWVQRNLAAMGVDLDEVDYNEPKDLEVIYGELVEDAVCCRVKIIEKDDFINMRVGKATEPDEDLLVDPKEALKGGGSSSSSSKGNKAKDTKDDEIVDDADGAFDVGVTVEFKKGRKKVQGKIKDFTDDDEAIIDHEGDEVIMSLDKLEIIEAEESEAEESEDEEASDEITRDSLSVGTRVTVDFGEDGEVDGEITSIPARGKKVQVTCDDDPDTPEMVEVSAILKVLSGDADDADDDAGLEFEAGDEVTFKKGRKNIDGVIKSVKGDMAKVKIEGQRKQEEVELDKLSHARVD